MLCVAVFVFLYSSRPFGGGSEAPHLKAAMKCHLCQLPAGLWGQVWVCWAAQCPAGTGTDRDAVPKEQQWLRPALTINSFGFGVTLGSVLPGTAHPTPAFGALQDTPNSGTRWLHTTPPATYGNVAENEHFSPKDKNM